MFRKALGIVVGIVMMAAGVSPDDAAFNLSKWATKLGTNDISSWLSSPTTNLAMLILGLLIILAALFGEKLVRSLRREAKSTNEVGETKSPATVPDASVNTFFPKDPAISMKDVKGVGIQGNHIQGTVYIEGGRGISITGNRFGPRRPTPKNDTDDKGTT